MSEIVKDRDIYISGTNIKIGISDALHDHTFDDIFNSPYCASSWDWIKNFQNQYFGWFIRWGHPDANNAPLSVPFYNPWSYPSGYRISNGEMTYNNAEGVFARVIYLYSPGSFPPSVTQNSNNIYVVTNIDVNKFRLLFTPFEKSTDDNAAAYTAQLQYKDNNNEYHNYDFIKPYIMFTFDGNNFLYMPFGTSTTEFHYSIKNTPQTDSAQAFLWNAQMHSWDETIKTSIALNINTNGEQSGDSATTKRLYRITQDNPDIGAQIIIGYDGNGGIKYVPDNADAYNKIISLYGFPFYTDKDYKPLISEGYVYGYTDDLTAESDIDNYTYDSGNKHSVPDAPIKPVTDDDIQTDMSAFQAYMGSGMVKYYYTESLEKLNQISAALGNWDNIETGKDVLKNLISLKCFGIASGAGGYIRGFLEDFEIAGTKLKVSSTSEDIIQMARITSVQAIDLGSFSVQPKFNDFRDYAPYTKIEMFVPLCGWVALPAHCMGKTVSGKLNFDYINGSCIAHIYCDKTEVAQITGYMGFDTPFTADNVGVKMAGVVSGMMAVGTSVIGTAAGLASGNAVGSALGALGLVNSVSQTVMSNNANYTEVKGRTGDGCNICGLQKVFLKIQRPVSHVPKNYGDTIGYVANKQASIASCSGLTVCANVDTDGIAGATASEREKIKSLLESGIRV